MDQSLSHCCNMSSDHHTDPRTTTEASLFYDLYVTLSEVTTTLIAIWNLATINSIATG
jgi:hypothetical protein